MNRNGIEGKGTSNRIGEGLFIEWIKQFILRNALVERPWQGMAPSQLPMSCFFPSSQNCPLDSHNNNVDKEGASHGFFILNLSFCFSSPH